MRLTTTLNSFGLLTYSKTFKLPTCVFLYTESVAAFVARQHKISIMGVLMHHDQVGFTLHGFKNVLIPT